MVTKLTIACAAAVLALVSPTFAQDNNSGIWAPWSPSDSRIEPTPAVTVTFEASSSDSDPTPAFEPTVVNRPRVQVAAAVVAEPEPAPTRLIRFDRFWMVGSFR